MANKEIIICIHNNRVFFNSDLSISIDDTNIPKEYFARHKHKKILWRIEQRLYQDNCLTVRLKEFDPDNIEAFQKQEHKKEKSIEKLFFENPDWTDLDMVLMGYKKVQIENSLSYNYQSLFPQVEITSIKNKQPESFSNQTQNISLNFWVDFSELQFKFGYAAFSQVVEQINRKVDFKIVNDHLLAEFDCIKFWFAKLLKTKRIKVVTNIKMRGHEIIDIEASSVHINKITTELIDSVKYQRTYGLIKSPDIKIPDKSLFTAEDIFNQFEYDIEGNTFKQTELDILSLLSEKSNIRNRSQLQYLSGGKQSEKHKLRYTLHPNFGFLFLIEGESNNHFIWELLNSHATYIWSIAKSSMSVELQYKRIESTINNIRLAGRDEYKRSYRNNHHDSDLAFTVLEHQQANSNFKDGFLKWKNKLNEMLV
jgi:hypothetical protein